MLLVFIHFGGEIVESNNVSQPAQSNLSLKLAEREISLLVGCGAILVKYMINKRCLHKTQLQPEKDD
jgi:hypothetical protein